MFDGAFSRWIGATSDFGRWLDPVADKVFVGMLAVTFVLEGSMSIVAMLLIGLRDLAVCMGVGWVLARGMTARVRTMSPTWLGKVTTTAQFLFLLTVLIAPESVFVPLVVTALLSGAAAVQYVVRFLREESRS